MKLCRKYGHIKITGTRYLKAIVRNAETFIVLRRKTGLCDERRNIFGIHPAGRQWYLLRGEEAAEPALVLSEEEEMYQSLFRHFCETIAIRDRKNLELQRNMLPLRFREYMVEFQ